MKTRLVRIGNSRGVRLPQPLADAFYVSVARLVDPAGAGRASLLIVGAPVSRR